MKEQKVLFETAKLAKEKGFSNGSFSYYTQYHKKYVYDNSPEHPESHKKNEVRYDDRHFIANFEYDFSNKNYTLYEAPTQSLLQKWLREKHNIAVLIQVDDNLENNVYRIHTCIKKAFSNRICPNTYYPTYEEALEIGLQEALKLI